MLERDTALKIFTGAAALLVLLVSVQAVIAGQFLFQGADIAVHGYVGNASFMVGLVLAGVAILGRLPIWLRIGSIAVVLALFAQTGLGYVGRESGFAASWHIPLGVLTFGLAVALLTGGITLVAGSTREDARPA
jgi:hypothetical protein